MNKRKKVLFVFHDSNPSSGAIAAMIDIFDGFCSKNNFDIECLIPNTGYGLSRALSEREITFYETFVPSCRYKWNCPFIIQAISFIKAVINTLMAILIAIKFVINHRDFDLVYTNTSATYLGVFISIFLKKKHIWHIREFGNEDQSVNQVLGFDLFVKFALRYSSSLIVISKALRDKILNINFSDKIKLIHDDVLINNQEHRQVNDGDFYFSNPLKMLITGTLCDGKGQRFVIYGISKLLNKGFDVHLGIAGDDRSNYAKELKKLVAKLGIEEHVTFHGFCNNMSSIRNKYQLSIIASKSEAFGRVTIESMMAEQLVIASNSGANVELIEHGNTGFLYECDRLDSFVSLIEYVYKNRSYIPNVVKSSKTFARRFCSGFSSRDIHSLIVEELEE